jgi:hypothetical protein
MQRIKIRFLADYQHLCKIPTDSSQTLHEIFIHNALIFLNSAVRKMNVKTLCLYLFASDFHASRIQLAKHFYIALLILTMNLLSCNFTTKQVQSLKYIVFKNKPTDRAISAWQLYHGKWWWRWWLCIKPTFWSGMHSTIP